MSEASPTRAGSRTGSAGSLSAQQTITPPLAGTSGAGKSRHAAGSPGSADGEGDGKAKKKSGGGFLNRLKKLTR